MSFDPGERSMAAMADLAGSGNLIWASDFPHSDAKYPGVVDELREHTASMRPDDRAALLGGNAVRLYGIEELAAHARAPRDAELDLVVRGGLVVDGTGAPGRTADVAVADGRIVEVGRVDGAADEVIDADGCVVAPGFVDIHTHYDAQLHWEPTASPSSWHGVTTVITGNCGFSLFPARHDDVEWLLHMLSRVEGMPVDALTAGVPFAGGGYEDFAAGLRGRLGVNVGLQVGHSALRRYVMRDDAATRAATPDEVAAMADLARDALRDGAVGFTSSQLDLHVDHHGNPVPSNLAAHDELVAIAAVLGDFEHGAIEFISGTNLEGHSDDDRRLMLDMCAAAGKPMNINPLQPLPTMPDVWRRGLEFAEEAERAGARIFPQSATQQLQVFFALHDTFLFDEMPAFRATLTASDPEAQLRDPAVRDAMRTQWADTEWAGDRLHLGRDPHRALRRAPGPRRPHGARAARRARGRRRPRRVPRRVVGGGPADRLHARWLTGEAIATRRPRRSWRTR